MAIGRSSIARPGRIPTNLRDATVPEFTISAGPRWKQIGARRKTRTEWHSRSDEPVILKWLLASLKRWSKLEREVQELNVRLKSGEISSEFEYQMGFFDAVERAMPKMTKKEAVEVQRWALTKHGDAAAELARRGRPLPGNDPGNPN
jgi:hypothetical protein